MRQPQLFWFSVVLVIVAVTNQVGLAKATYEVDPTTISLEQPVHFLTPDGSDVIVKPGTYEVGATQEWIRLIPDERRNAVFGEALPTIHEEMISSPIGLSLSGEEGEQADVHHLLLLLPDGTGLDAIGI